jgi:ubiquinone/menaquinone biosynthesis C-methylase UbiE
MFGRPRGLLGSLGGIIMARTNSEAAMQTINWLDVRRCDKVLEIGFGPGVGIQLLAERCSRGFVKGIDQSPVMVEQAMARNAKKIESGRVEISLGSVEALPFTDATFDKAMAINSMQIWSDAVAGLREVRRVLKPGTQIALAFTIHSGQPRKGLAELLVAAGFEKAYLVERKALFCCLASKPGAARVIP